MTSIQIDEREKQIFSELILSREKLLQEEMNALKTLKAKLQTDNEVKNAKVKDQKSKAIVTPETLVKAKEHLSWVEIVKKELIHFSHPVPSGEVVKRLLNNPDFSEKDKRFITKAVTSKLWLLQERGEVIKSRENGKYVYSIKNSFS